jgi:hypothetical protein
MSTQPLSPLEQLALQPPTASTELSPIEQLALMGNQTTPSKPDDNLSPLEQLEAMGRAQQPSQQQPSQQTNQEDEASNTRQMLVSGLTGMPTPNMNDADRASFQRGKAAGALSVPAVAAATLGATEIGAALAPNYGTVGGAVMTHLTEQAAEWAAKYPGLIKVLTHAGVPSGLGGVIGYLIHKAK